MIIQLLVTIIIKGYIAYYIVYFTMGLFKKYYSKFTELETLNTKNTKTHIEKVKGNKKGIIILFDKPNMDVVNKSKITDKYDIIIVN